MASLSVFAAGVDASDRRAEQLHPEDVQRLPLHVLGAHVDVAVEPEQRADRRRRDAVLAGAGLGDDAPLAHALREERLPERVVDLVRAGVREVLALEEDARAAERLAEPPRLVERRRPARRSRAAADAAVRRTPSSAARRGTPPRSSVDGRHERLRHEPAAVGAVVAARVRVALATRRLDDMVIRRQVVRIARRGRRARRRTPAACRGPSRRATTRRRTTHRWRTAARDRCASATFAGRQAAGQDDRAQPGDRRPRRSSRWSGRCRRDVIGSCASSSIVAAAGTSPASARASNVAVTATALITRCGTLA